MWRRSYIIITVSLLLILLNITITNKILKDETAKTNIIAEASGD